MMMSELMEENVKQLVGAQRALGEVQDVSPRRRFDGNADSTEQVGVLDDVIPVRNELRQIPRLSANRHQSRTMKTIAVAAPRREQDDVQSGGQFGPIGQDP